MNNINNKYHLIPTGTARTYSICPSVKRQQEIMKVINIVALYLLVFLF